VNANTNFELGECKVESTVTGTVAKKMAVKFANLTATQYV
jgi:hypothetical protein